MNLPNGTGSIGKLGGAPDSGSTRSRDAADDHDEASFADLAEEMARPDERERRTATPAAPRPVRRSRHTSELEAAVTAALAQRQSMPPVQASPPVRPPASVDPSGGTRAELSAGSAPGLAPPPRSAVGTQSDAAIGVRPAEVKPTVGAETASAATTATATTTAAEPLPPPPSRARATEPDALQAPAVTAPPAATATAATVTMSHIAREVALAASLASPDVATDSAADSARVSEAAAAVGAGALPSPLTGTHSANRETPVFRPGAPIELPGGGAEALGPAGARVVIGEGDQRVAVRITLRGDTVTVHAHAVDPALAADLVAGAADLAASLGRRGLKLGSFSAAGADDPEALSGTAGNEDDDPNPSHPSRRRVRTTA